MTFVPSAEQLAIIDHGMEPLRVTAGAGTGKTTTLAYRVVRLEDRFGIRPGEVLGVTFTNKAADELAQRIRQARASAFAPGHEVDVFTYHGFATDLLGTYGALVGYERGTRIITPARTRQLLRECLADTRFEAVDVTNIPGVVDSLVRLSGELADNLIRPADLLALPAGDEVEVRRAELATVLVGFERSKAELGVRDYGDLILLAVELVRGHPEVAERIRSRYRCVLLDEYQDTNPAQRELFAALFGRHGAITAVGDLDQTIYEWRGASPANFEGFPDRFRRTDGAKALTLRLTFNRRSGQRIVDLADRIRTRISSGSGSAGLQALPGAPAGEVHASWYGDARREAEEIARELRRLHETGVGWSEMAVLFRRNRDMELLRLALEEHDVPLQVADLGGLLQVPEIVELHAWMRVLADPEDSPAMVRILLGSGFRLGLSGLTCLSRWVAERSRRTGSEAARPTLAEALEHLDTMDIDDDTRWSLDNFGLLYRTLLAESQGRSVSEVARMVLSRTGAWQEIDAMPSPSDLSARLNVHRFLDFTEHWNPLRGQSSVAAFLDHLDLLRDDPSEQLDTARIGDGNAVTLTTVHRAKGLEWRAVFLPALCRGNFPASPRRLLDPSLHDFTLPSCLRIDTETRTNLDPAREPDTRREWLRDRHDDQEWRLAYVACTRAKEYLYLSGAHWYGVPQTHKKPSRPSELLELARDLDGAVTDDWTTEPPPRPEEIRFPVSQPGPDPVLGMSWEEALHKVSAEPDWAARRADDLAIGDLYDVAVEEFEQTLLDLPEPDGSDPPPDHSAVSVTGLVTYATCPKRYYWTDVDRLPRRPGPGARRGTRLHRRIELHNRGMIPFDDLDEELYDRSPTELSAERGETEGGWRAFLGSAYATRAPVFVEVPFELRLAPGVRIRGRVDAVYPLGDRGWEIVDFKSGRRPGDTPDDIQLQAYAVAARDGGLGAAAPDSMCVSFVYLGGGLEVLGQEVDEAWLQKATQRILELVENIRAEHFEATPSPACRTCDFRHVCPEGKEWLSASGYRSGAGKQENSTTSHKPQATSH